MKKDVYELGVAHGRSEERSKLLAEGWTSSIIEQKDTEIAAQKERIKELMEEAKERAHAWRANKIVYLEKIKALQSVLDVQVELIACGECQRLRDVLEVIAMPKRADGTYNRSREACENLAWRALRGL